MMEKRPPNPMAWNDVCLIGAITRLADSAAAVFLLYAVKIIVRLSVEIKWITGVIKRVMTQLEEFFLSLWKS